MKQITVHGDEMYGVNSQDMMFYKRMNDKLWKYLDTRLKQVSYDGTTLCGVKDLGTIYCATKDIKTANNAPQWELIPRKMAQVIVVGKTIFGVNAKNEIYMVENYFTLRDITRKSTWVKLNGLLQQISSDGKRMCGVNAENDAFCGDVGSIVHWNSVGSGMKHVQILGDELFGTNVNNTPMVSAYPNVDWKPLNGKLTQITFSSLAVPPPALNKLRQ